MGDLENRVVIITGGARGIGLGIAEAVADQGACVVLADILGEEAKESAKKLGNIHLGIKHDVRKADSAKNLVDQTLESSAASTSSSTTPAWARTPRPSRT